VSEKETNEGRRKGRNFVQKSFNIGKGMVTEKN